MKNLHEYETPETNAAWKDGYTYNVEDLTKSYEHACNLEQRLAACRGGLQKLYDALDSCVDLTPELLRECRETLTLTEPKP